MDSDIRKWFLKQPHKSSGNATSDHAEKPPESANAHLESRPDLKKTSKFFSGSQNKACNEEKALKTSTEKPPTKRKQEEKAQGFQAPEENHDVKKEKPSPKKAHVGEVKAKDKEKAISPSPKKSHTNGKVTVAKDEALDDGDDEYLDDNADDGDFKDVDIKSGHDSSPAKGKGRGRGRGVAASSVDSGKPPSGGRGRGGWGRGGGGSFFEPRPAPPHKGEKVIQCRTPFIDSVNHAICNADIEVMSAMHM
jgi:hypothetical protein